MGKVGRRVRRGNNLRVCLTVCLRGPRSLILGPKRCFPYSSGIVHTNVLPPAKQGRPWTRGGGHVWLRLSTGWALTSLLGVVGASCLPVLAGRWPIPAVVAAAISQHPCRVVSLIGSGGARQQHRTFRPGWTLNNRLTTEGVAVDAMASIPSDCALPDNMGGGGGGGGGGGDGQFVG